MQPKSSNINKESVTFPIIGKEFRAIKSKMCLQEQYKERVLFLISEDVRPCETDG